MLADELRAYSIDTAARVGDVSARQLTYWAETGLVGPSVDRHMRSRRVRLWSFQDVIEVCVVAELLRRGRSLQQVRFVVEFIRGRDEVSRPLSQVVFLVDQGTGEIAWIGAEGQVEGIRRPGQLLMRETVDLEEIRRGIRGHQMRDANDFGRVERRRGRMGSKQVFAGTRTPVETLRPYLERGFDTERILQSFPHLDEVDVEFARHHLSVA